MRILLSLNPLMIQGESFAGVVQIDAGNPRTHCSLELIEREMANDESLQGRYVFERNPILKEEAEKENR